eukprot:7390567-Prymnesium_polylepis.2
MLNTHGCDDRPTVGWPPQPSRKMSYGVPACKNASARGSERVAASNSKNASSSKMSVCLQRRSSDARQAAM